MATLVNTIPNQKAIEGQLFSYTIPSNTFSYTGTPNYRIGLARKDENTRTIPNWLSFDESTLVISGTPTDFSDLEYYQFSIFCNDGNGEASENFSLVVHHDGGHSLTSLPILPKHSSGCTYLLNTTNIAGFNFSQVQPGETIGLSAGTYGAVNFDPINYVATREELPTLSGHGKEVLITNIGGSVRITGGTSYGAKIGNSNYLKWLGQGTSTDPYGFKISTEPGNGVALQVKINVFNNIELSYLEILYSSAAGLSIKNDLGESSNEGARPTADMYNIRVHDCYITSAGTEGIYAGTGFFDGRNYNNGLPNDDHFYFIGSDIATKDSLAQAELTGEEYYDSGNTRWLYEWIGDANAGTGTTKTWLDSKSYVLNTDYTYVSGTTLYPHDIYESRFHDNIIFYSGWDGGQFKNCVNNCKIYNNFFFSSGTANRSAQNYGLFFSDGTTGEIYNNWVQEIANSGIRGYISGPVNVYNNIVINAGTHAFYGASSGAAVSGNTGATSNVFNNTFINYGLKGGDNEAFECYPDINNVNLKNNLFIKGSFGSETIKSSGNFVQSNNLFVSTEVDAYFTDYLNHDYRIKSISPARNAGTTVTGRTHDFNGVSASTNDVGAFTIGSTPNTDRWNYIVNGFKTIARRENIPVSTSIKEIGGITRVGFF